MRHHPGTRYGDFIVVEDLRSREIVSTVCPLPWQYRFEGLDLRVAMLEMVLTDPRYRRRGLVRAQIGRFHHLAAERGFDLCVIEGIPYYYRQFGYAYACEHWAHDRLPAQRIPRQAAGQPHPCRLRPAVVEDAPQLLALYQESMSSLQLATLRDLDYWRYLLLHAALPGPDSRRPGGWPGPRLCLHVPAPSHAESAGGRERYPRL